MTQQRQKLPTRPFLYCLKKQDKTRYSELVFKLIVLQKDASAMYYCIVVVKSHVNSAIYWNINIKSLGKK